MTLATGSFRFERFTLNPDDRLLRENGVPAPLNARYLDALVLLVREQGRLVSKDRFLAEVWRGAPVTDEALTQCIRTLRRRLGDDAARPRFIETAPKHGYRFIAPVEWIEAAALPVASAPAHGRTLALVIAGSVGAGVAGLTGGLLYGSIGAAQAPASGAGALSIVLVLMVVTALVALAGGAAVSLGVALGLRSGRPGPGAALGGALGGLLVGGAGKLLGLDAFNLLVGAAPAGITGAFEGGLLGGGVGLGAWLTLGRKRTLPALRAAATAGLVGAATGVLIPLLGGRLMAGSLDLLLREFPAARLRLGPLEGLFGEHGFGPWAQAATGGLEGLLFGSGIVGAMALAARDGRGSERSSFTSS
jgi:DNA-binding winged helix-turn-helix (wHTH) protein